MPTGTIVAITQDGINAYASVVVVEGSRNVEYTGSVPLLGDLAAFGFAGQTWGQLTTANKKIALTAAVKAARDAQFASVSSGVAGISGSVVL